MTPEDREKVNIDEREIEGGGGGGGGNIYLDTANISVSPSICKVEHYEDCMQY